jgi:hypothetical protein
VKLRDIEQERDGRGILNLDYVMTSLSPQPDFSRLKILIHSYSFNKKILAAHSFYSRNKLVAACILEGELPYLDLVGSKGTTFINDSVN